MVWRNKFSPLTMLRESHLTCSQYAEDMIFERLMRPGSLGTYVDVGSHHPYKGSNTFRLYAHGWRGMTVDPNPRFASLAQRVRPGDIHLMEGVSSQRGELSYYQFENDVMNTLSEDRAASLVAAGNRVCATITVRCRPLAEMVEEKLGERQIDLLNVDCEGLDLDAIRSIDLEVHRPTVLMVEDYPSLNSFQSHGKPGDLEKYLRQHGYTPIAQSAWTTILVANDWPVLFARSPAFAAERVQNGYLPGQV
jgi:FkbM family methyltransferase